MKFGEKQSTGLNIDYYLTWKGGADKGYFEYWDKEEKEAKTFELNKPFIVLDTKECIRGFSQKSEGGAFSNEIELFDFKKVELFVRCKGQIIHKGLYGDIKGDCNADGLSLHTAVTALMDGQVIKFFLKGRARSLINDLIREVSSEFKLEVEEIIEDGKAIRFKEIHFKKGPKLTKKDIEKATELASQIGVKEELKEENTDINEEDIPF